VQQELQHSQKQPGCWWVASFEPVAEGRFWTSLQRAQCIVAPTVSAVSTCQVGNNSKRGGHAVHYCVTHGDVLLLLLLLLLLL
jgi:hypothetical protein